jgi:signal transduction histidine kinase
MAVRAAADRAPRVAVVKRDESEPRDAVDRFLDRLYATVGWRIPYVILGAALVTTVLAVAGGALMIARVGQLSGHDTAVLAGIGVAAVIVTFICSFVLIRPAVAPISAWARGGPAAEAWDASHHLPAKAFRCVAGPAALIELPAVVLAVLAGAPGSLGMVVFAELCVIGIMALITELMAFGLQVALRPVTRDIESSLTGRPPLRPGMSVRVKLLLALPVFVYSASIGAIVLATPPGTSWNSVLARTAVIWGLGALYVMPAALLLGYSVVRPLADLMRATDRLGRGDLESRVPELTPDEYGFLARSFNDAMAGLSERERLAAANEELLADVRASRARILTASDAERRRVERNIHDGAQQRLVAVSLDLRMLQDAAGSAAREQLESMAAEAGANLREALDELRELARGLHPSVLDTDGLAPALRQLASRSPVPVVLDVAPERFAVEIESTIYFVAAEALANVAKYARASRVEISVAAAAGRLVVRITDDGAGGADPRAGTGIAGLEDRLAALDGTLRIDSPRGGGTTVTAELPLAHDPC